MDSGDDETTPAFGREPAPNGVLTDIAPRVRRLIAPNASAFTYTGTCSYIVGEGEVAILDPGPDDDAHLAMLLAAVARERVAYIVISHTHRDHSAGVARLREATGARIVGARPHLARPGAAEGLDASHDATYAPDAVMQDGERIEFGGAALTAVATPGHSANHLCFALEGSGGLFSGDHVMAWSTSVVAPPDGSMREYMVSLEKLRARDERIYWPGHGGPVREPARYLRGLISHRRQREASILSRLEGGPMTVRELVAKNYSGLDPRLVGAAGLSTRAHLEDLISRGLVAREPEPGSAARYRRV